MALHVCGGARCNDACGGELAVAFEIINADVIDGLRSVDAASVHCVITSPPYYGLRTYQGVVPRRWEDSTESVFGEEDTLERYIAHAVEVFRELKRVLHPTGTFWLNIGDAYNHMGTAHAEPNIYKAAEGHKPNRTRLKYSSIRLKETDKAWLAALIDGEGCIQAHCQQNRRPEWAPTYQVDVGVAQMDSQMVKKAHAVTGLGSCSPQSSGVWKWSVRGQQAAVLLQLVYPYLLIKQQQAAIAIMLADDLAARRFNRVRPAEPEALAYRASLKDAIHRLNQRENTDIDIRQPGALNSMSTKDLLMVPARMAMALQADGWILRQDNIWAKGVSFLPSFSGTVMPESTRDRTTWAHEHLFQFALHESYFYDQDGCREPFAATTVQSVKTAYAGRATKDYATAGAQNPSDTKRRILDSVRHGEGRNLRNVWIVPKENFNEWTETVHWQPVAVRALSDGTRRKVSPGCPVHGGLSHHVATVSCDARGDFDPSYSGSNSVGPAELPAPFDVANTSHHIPSQAERQPKLGLRDQYYSPSAIVRNKKIHKTDPVVSTSPACSASAENGNRTADTLVSLLTHAPSSHKDVSKNEEQACLTVWGILERIDDRSGHSSWLDSCLCEYYHKDVQKTSHFATFPRKLVEPVVKLATSEKGCCPHCAAPIRRKTIREPVPEAVQAAFNAARSASAETSGRTDGHTRSKPNYRRKVLRTEWEKGCSCEFDERDSQPCVVLDIFNGSGRAGIVAVGLGRDYIGIDASADYCAMAGRAIGDAAGRCRADDVRVPDGVLCGSGGACASDTTADADGSAA